MGVNEKGPFSQRKGREAGERRTPEEKFKSRRGDVLPRSTQIGASKKHTNGRRIGGNRRDITHVRASRGKGRERTAENWETVGNPLAKKTSRPADRAGRGHHPREKNKKRMHWYSRRGGRKRGRGPRKKKGEKR